jgi:hypothetical protein
MPGSIEGDFIILLILVLLLMMGTLKEKSFFIFGMESGNSAGS